MRGTQNILLYSTMLLVSLCFSSMTILAQNVKIEIEAPQEVWTGDRFRVDYVVESDADVDGSFKIKDFKDIEVLSGPTQSFNASSSVVSGKREVKYIRKISYILKGDKAGKSVLPQAEFVYNGKRYKTSKTIVNLKAFEQLKNKKHSFVRTIVSRTNVGSSDTLMLTYRLYTMMYFRKIVKADFPSVVKDFYSDKRTLYRQEVQKEEIDGETYNVIDLRCLILQPRSIGAKNIPSGSVTIEFGVPTGKKKKDFVGDTYEEIFKEVQTLPIEGAKISVQNLIEV